MVNPYGLNSHKVDSTFLATSITSTSGGSTLHNLGALQGLVRGRRERTAGPQHESYVLVLCWWGSSEKFESVLMLACFLLFFLEIQQWTALAAQ